MAKQRGTGNGKKTLAVPSPGSNSAAKTRPASAGREPASYSHPTSDSPLRPDVGTQAQFKKRKAPAKYKYDSSLSPAMEYDGQNPAREAGEAHLAAIDARLAAAHGALAAASEQLDAMQTGVGAKSSKEVSAAGARLKEARAAVDAAAQANRALRGMSRPFLNWAGKAERLSFDVPTLPLFVHERLSTAAIIDTLTGHKRDRQLSLFSDPQRPVAEQVLRAYEHRDQWVNRMVLGDSLAIMNSLLHYEGLGGQVQMIYMDPPYGVKFGSNFQPFVRKRDVSHNDDEDMTREPEMVQAYRDTWELGLHSYLTYLRDRLLLARELLTPSGSVFVQIGDENVHHVREVLDEVYGQQNFVSLITFQKTSGSTGELIGGTSDYLLWYARDIERIKSRPAYVGKSNATEIGGPYNWLQLIDGHRRRMLPDERNNPNLIPDRATAFRLDNLQSQSMGREKGEGAACWFPVKLGDKEFLPNARSRWKTNESGMSRLLEAQRLQSTATALYYIRFISDFPAMPLGNNWTDTVIAGFASEKTYVVETTTKAVERCLLMTTDPGDLVFDPTCGSGTTAYVAEQWGRRWITADVSRVPLALARQRLLTATFPWYELKDESRGPAGGFVYKRRQNNKGEEVGGIVPHVTLKSIANNEPPDEEVLVDRPEEANKITRITGPFAFEAMMPTPADWDSPEKKSGGDAASTMGGGSRGEQSGGEAASTSAAGSVDRMLEVLRKSPVLRLDGNKTVTLRNIRRPARSLSLSAEATVDGNAAGGALTPAEAVQISMEQDGHSLPLSSKPVAIVFGPENGAVSDRLVWQAAMEAHAKGFAHLYVIGFAIQPNARQTIEQSAQALDIPATYVQATQDLLMGDLLKNMRSSQVFSVCGLPEIKVSKSGKGELQVELLGVDVFDPVTMQTQSRGGNDVPAWFLDTDYNGLCFHVCQAFFPRTAAWDNLRKSLRGTYDEAVWDHLAGNISAPFEAGEQKQIAVKVIDDRGNELMVVKSV
ncbi:MAG TPA: site-specific DNA-methyltransferase [Tepidisphaeraceae bacterium]|nr:site-specific DNA-methyltransferase [Tepidisphaeraceae bacterium]